MRIATILSLVVSSLIVIGSAHAQVSCVQSGPFISCVGPNGQLTNQAQLSPTQGVLSDDRGRLEPYLILPTQPQPVRPLNDVLPKLESPRSPSSPSLFLDNGSTVLQPSGPVFVPMYGGEGSQ